MEGSGMTNILVTGGTGFIGRTLVDKLLDDGYSIRVLDNFSRQGEIQAEHPSESVELVSADVREYASVREAVAGVDTVVHLAAINGTDNFYDRPGDVVEVAIKGTLNTAEAALATDVERFLFASSSEVYQRPNSIPTDETERLLIPDITNPRFSYSAGKIMGEALSLHYLQNRGIDTVVFRPHNIYGANMGLDHVIPEFMVRMKQELEAGNDSMELEIQGDGSQTRAFCFIDDAAEGIRLLVERGRGGEIYNVGTEQEVTIERLARLIGSIAGLDIDIVPGPIPEGSTPRRCPDVSKLRSIGYEPRWELQEGLRETWNWYAENLSDLEEDERIHP